MLVGTGATRRVLAPASPRRLKNGPYKGCAQPYRGSVEDQLGPACRPWLKAPRNTKQLNAMEWVAG